MRTLYLHEKNPETILSLKGNPKIGKSGAVYQATSKIFCEGKKVLAVKIYLKGLDSKTEQIINSLIASNLQEQSHLFLPKVFVVDDNNKKVGYAMAWAEGFIDLEEFYSQKERNDFDYTVTFAIKLCELVDKIHQEGFLIGDLSRKNIMVNEQKELILIDCDSFGKKTSQPSYIPQGDYAPPEIYQGQSSDLFMAGIHLSELLFGIHPFAGRKAGNDQAMIESNIKNGWSWLWNDQVKLPSGASYNQLPSTLIRELKKILSFNPEQRPANLNEVKREIIKFKNNDYQLLTSEKKADESISSYDLAVRTRRNILMRISYLLAFILSSIALTKSLMNLFQQGFQVAFIDYLIGTLQLLYSYEFYNLILRNNTNDRSEEYDYFYWRAIEPISYSICTYLLNLNFIQFIYVFILVIGVFTSHIFETNES